MFSPLATYPFLRRPARKVFQSNSGRTPLERTPRPARGTIRGASLPLLDLGNPDEKLRFPVSSVAYTTSDPEDDPPPRSLPPFYFDLLVLLLIFPLFLVAIEPPLLCVSSPS